MKLLLWTGAALCGSVTAVFFNPGACQAQGQDNYRTAWIQILAIDSNGKVIGGLQALPFGGQENKEREKLIEDVRRQWPNASLVEKNAGLNDPSIDDFVQGRAKLDLMQARVLGPTPTQPTPAKEPRPSPSQSTVPPVTNFDRTSQRLKEWYGNRNQNVVPIPHFEDRARKEIIDRFDGFRPTSPSSPPPSNYSPNASPMPNPSPTPPRQPSAAPAPKISPSALTPLTKAPAPAPMKSRGYGYDNNLPKELAPRGVTMRVNIDQATLQRADAPPALFDAIRSAK